MQDLIADYRQQLDALENRQKQLERLKKKLRGRDYFELLKRLDAINQEIIEINCALAYMVKEHGDS